MFKSLHIIRIILLFCISFSLHSQNQTLQETKNDSLLKSRQIKKENYSAPRRASIMSMLLPGLGQAYNKKYWKIPVIYAGMGACTYFFISNNTEYSYYRKNLIALNDDDPATTNETVYTSEQLQVLKNDFKKKRDLAAIGFSLIYLLNIIDANVDAHLKTFDVNDDLSIQLKPWHEIRGSWQHYQLAAGISLKIQLK